MADFNKLLSGAVKKLADFSDPKKAGTALLIINVFSTALAAVTNTFAAAIDKNTSAEDKKFLVPAGIATGVANIGMYLALTLKAIDAMEKKAENVIKEMFQKGTFSQNVQKYTSNILEKAKNKKYYSDMGKFLQEKKSIDSNQVKEFFGGFETLAKEGNLKEVFKGGITNADMQYMETIKGFGSVMGAFIGVVVGYGILSPVIRDVSAYFVQKHMEKRNPKYKDAPYRPYFDPGHFKVGYASKKQPLNMNTYMAFTRSKAFNSKDSMTI